MRLSFVVELLRRPRWLPSSAVDGGAYLLQVLALRAGSLLVVQTLLVFGLAFTLAFPAAEQCTKPQLPVPSGRGEAGEEILKESLHDILVLVWVITRLRPPAAISGEHNRDLAASRRSFLLRDAGSSFPRAAVPA